MKKYVLFLVMCIAFIIKSVPVGDETESYKYFPLKKPWKHKKHKSRSLKKLCVKAIWSNPRAYIGADSKLNNEMKEYIVDECLTMKIQLHFGFKIEDINFASRFVSQLLLIKACYQSLKKLDKDKKITKIIMSKQEEAIFNEIPSTMQQNMSYYLEKKS